MFSKEEIKQKFREERENAIAHNQPMPEAGLTLALLIMSCAHFSKKLRSGEDYSEHPVHVGFTDTRSTRKQIVGILHDVIEDSDWTLDDLREIGFDERIVLAVDALTGREGELYFDFIVRCGNSFADCEYDAIDNKIRDLEHNSTNTRYFHVTETEKQIAKRYAYNIAHFYLVSIKKGNTKPGTPISTFISKEMEHDSDKEAANKLLDMFSSETFRFWKPEPGLNPEPA